MVLTLAVLMAAVLAASPPDAGRANAQWPLSIEAAAQRLCRELKPDDAELVRKTPREDLISFHRGWGSGIRSSFGLWEGNTICGPRHPDECSMLIIERTWELLQRDGG